MSTEPTTTPAPVTSPAPTITPNAAATARAQLDGLTKNAEWSAKFFAGDVATRREFSELIAAIANGDDVADAIAGTTAPPAEIETVSDGQLPSRALASVVDSMRETGLSDGAIAEGVKGARVSRQEYEAARRYQQIRHSDKEWVGRLLSGDWNARREQILCSIILSGDVV